MTIERRPGSSSLPAAEPRLGVLSFAEHRGRAVRFLRPGVPIGNVTTVAGDGGLGKSLLALGWAAEVAAADDGGHALIVVAEDGPDVAKLRLRALEANLERCHFVTIDWGTDDDGNRDYDGGGIRMPEQADELEAIVAGFGGSLRLLVVDPWSENLDGSVDAHQAKSLRTAIAALRRIAARYSLAVVVVAHLNKAASTSLRKRIDGSGALYDGSRSVFLFAREPGSSGDQGEADTARVLAHDKCNVAAKQLPRSYSIVGPVMVESLNGEPRGDTAKVVPGETSEHGVAALLECSEGRPGGDRQSSGKDAAVAYLLEHALADGECHKRAEVEPIALATTGVSRATLDRAYDSLVAHGIAFERHHGEWQLRPETLTQREPIGGEYEALSNSLSDAQTRIETGLEGVSSNGLLRPVSSLERVSKYRSGELVYCSEHQALKRVVRLTAGLAFLACGCHVDAAGKSRPG